MSFVIQQRAIMHAIWHEPKPIWLPKTRSDSVQELRGLLATYADTTTFDWRQHFRIITADGRPVARFVIRPGRVKETRRRY